VEQIRKIEILEGGIYRELQPDELQGLINTIDEERDSKLCFRAITSGRYAGYESFTFKDGHSVNVRRNT
jgi:hypothetical protein